ncbi:MAG TPA: anti-sigma factor [Gemmatimonadales bacterium]|nr:anti-sigma factor [Gemmatimonadales bacterium]
MTAHEWQEQAAPYALGILSPEERRAFEAHLAGCDACRADVRSYTEVAAALAHAAPAAEPPGALRDRVLAEARRVRPIGRRVPPRPPLPWLAAAAALLLAAAGAIATWRLTGRVHELERSLAVSDSVLGEDSAALALLTGPDVNVVSLAGTNRAPSARIVWNRALNRFVVFAFDLPAAPAGRTYQLWAIAKGHAPLSMGTFNTDAQGRARVVLPVDREIAALGFIDNCGLTEEPSGGSPQPTETPRLLGAWTRSD